MRYRYMIQAGYRVSTETGGISQIKYARARVGPSQITNEYEL